MLFNVIGWVALLGSVICLLWYANKNGLRHQGGKHLYIKDQIQIGPSQRIIYLKVGGENLVIGVTKERMQTLASINADENESAENKIITFTSRQAVHTFEDRLKQAWKMLKEGVKKS